MEVLYDDYNLGLEGKQGLIHSGCGGDGFVEPKVEDGIPELEMMKIDEETKTKTKTETRESEVFFPRPGLNPIKFMRELDPDAKEIEKHVQNYQSELAKYPPESGMGARWDLESVDVIKLLSGGVDVEEIGELKRGRKRKRSGKQNGNGNEKIEEMKRRDYLVNRDGDRVPLKELSGKHVFIFCFTVPLISGSAVAATCHALISLSTVMPHSLYKFVMVIVGRRSYSSCEEQDMQIAFNNFFSGFPAHFLAIPYEDSESRHSLCNYLFFSSEPDSEGFLVAPSCKVIALSLTDLEQYGSDCYPFTDDQRLKIDQEDDQLKARLDVFSYWGPFPAPDGPDNLDIRHFPVLTLAELLQCHEHRDRVLARINAPGKPMGATHTVSVLAGKIVGIYLCYDGSLMPTLKKLQEDCRNHEPRFEVVVVPLALRDHPSNYIHHIELALAHLNISAWWTISPHSDSLTRTLWRICCGSYLPRDKLVILPYGEAFSGEIHADVVLSCLGMYPAYSRVREVPGRLSGSVYPFTRERLYFEWIEALEQLQLTSLLERYDRCIFRCKDDHPISLEELTDNNVLLYLSSSVSPPQDLLCNRLLEIYPKILETNPGCQVVCVFSGVEPGDGYVSKLPWLKISPPEEAAQSLRKAIFPEDDMIANVIVAFGEDGCVRSRRVLNYRVVDPAEYDEDPVAAVFDCQLYREIFGEVTMEVESIVKILTNQY